MAKEKITTSIYWDKSLISNNNVVTIKINIWC